MTSEDQLAAQIAELEGTARWAMVYGAILIAVIIAALVIVTSSFGTTTITTSPIIICPHCGTQGHVHTTRIRQDVGISGNKAAAAVVTGGWSLLLTGLTRKAWATQGHCLHCDSTWTF